MEISGFKNFMRKSISLLLVFCFVASISGEGIIFFADAFDEYANSTEISLLSDGNSDWEEDEDDTDWEEDDDDWEDDDYFDENVESIEIATPPEKTEYIYECNGYWNEYWEYDEETEESFFVSYFCYNIYTDGMSIKVNYKDGTSEVFDIWDLETSIISQPEYDDVWEIGTHSVTVEYSGKRASFDVEVVENPVESIEVYALPNKTKYFFELDGQWIENWYYDSEADEEYCEEIFRYNVDENIDGLNLKVNYTDGTSEIVDIWDIDGVEISGQKNDEVWEIGLHKVEVLYCGRTAFYNVNVIENPVDSIEIYTLPYKTEYIQNINGSWDWDYCYDEETDEEIYTKCFRYDMDFQGLKIKVNYKDGTSNVFNDTSLDGLRFVDYKYGVWELGTQTITVNYANKTATFDIEVVENNISNIEIVSAPQKNKYVLETNGYWNERWYYDEETDEDVWEDYYHYEIDLAGTMLKINYNDGSSEVVNVITLDGVEGIGQDDGEVWGIGTHKAAVKYGDFTAEFDIEVIENPLSNLELIYFPEKAYLEGEYIDLRGAKFKLTYTDGTEEIVEISLDNYYDKRFKGYSFDLGYIGDYMFGIGPDYDGEGYIFTYLGHNVNIDVPHSEAKAVSLDFVKKPVGNLEGSVVAITLSDSSVIETKILAEDYRAGTDGEGFETNIGWICTEYGIFYGVLTLRRLFEPDKASMESFELAGAENVKEYKDFDEYFYGQRIFRLIRYIENYKRAFKIDDVSFYGEITEANADVIFGAAAEFVGYRYGRLWHELTGDNVTNAVKLIFGCDDVKLTLSEDYNESTEIYFIPNFNNGFNCNCSYTFEETPLGTGVITEMYDDLVGETSYWYVIFDESSKIVYLSTEKWNFPADEDDSFIDESTGIEIEHPGQPDIDFDVENLEGDAFLLVEETVIDNLGTDWELLKAFDITMKNKDGVHVQPDGTVKVKLPLDWEKDGSYKVYRVNEDGTLTDMNAYRQGSHMVFDADHFSIYIIVDESAPEEPDTPSDGETSIKSLKDLIAWFKQIIDDIVKFFRSIGKIF